jgi:hypothetical protein
LRAKQSMAPQAESWIASSLRSSHGRRWLFDI